MAYSVEIVVPRIVDIEQFNVTAKAIFYKIGLNSRKINSLISIRDVLLPKLMSSKIRITQ